MAEETLTANWPENADVDISGLPSSEQEFEALAERIRLTGALLGSTAERLWSSLQLRSPAAKSAVEALEKSTATTALTCVVCVEDLAVGSEIIKMPCSHQYHSDCILKWLEKRHTCPICRFQLPSQQSSS